MGKLVYQPQQDYMVQVSICSMSSFLILNPFSVNINDSNRKKIENVLDNSHESKFILFPEYTYSVELENIYQNYCNQYGCIIIGGTGLEEFGNNFYAFAPVFLPNKEPLKVYKRNITQSEVIHSGGRIIPYTDIISRKIRVESDEFDILISVFVCYDFLVESISERDDIIFVPQYEHSPEQYITQGDKISKGWENFVLGANNSNNNQRSIGFATLNSQVIGALVNLGWRQVYLDTNGDQLNYHHTIFYDTQGERVLKFKLNLGRPFSKAFTFNFANVQPIIVPLLE